MTGNIVYAVCQWGILIVLAKLTTTEMVGQFALGLAVTAPIVLLSGLALRPVLATDVRDEYSFGNYVGLRLVTTVLALVIIALVCCIGPYSINTAAIIMAVGLCKGFESISDIYYGFMQRHERMDLIAKSNILKGPLSLVALSATVFATGDVLWGVASLALTWGMLLLTFDLRNTKILMNYVRRTQWRSSADDSVRPSPNLLTIVRLAWLALPLGIVAGLLSLNTNIPRYFIEKDWGVNELGIFAALAYLIAAGNIIVSAMGQTVVPRLAQSYMSGDMGQYRSLLIRMIIIGLLLGIAGVLAAIVAGRPILILLYRPEYAERSSILVWIMIAGGISYMASLLGYGMTAARYFKAQLPLFVFVSIITALVSLWLIPVYGLLGASISLMAGSSVQLLGGGIIVSYATRHRIEILDAH